MLMKKIQDDQFLDLLTVKTEVRAVCKEPYRLSPKSQCQFLFIQLFMLVDVFDIMYILHVIVFLYYISQSFSTYLMHTLFCY